MTKFGYPNDEGLPEHPLRDPGLGTAPSSVMGVVASLWAAEVSNQMSASSRRIWGARHDASWERRNERRHFVIALKEATFECVASELAVVSYCATFDEAFAYVISRF